LPARPHAGSLCAGMEEAALAPLSGGGTGEDTLASGNNSGPTQPFRASPELLEWLPSNEAIAKLIADKIAGDVPPEDRFEFISALGKEGDPDLIKHLLESSGVIEGIADLVWNKVQQKKAEEEAAGDPRGILAYCARKDAEEPDLEAKAIQEMSRAAAASGLKPEASTPASAAAAAPASAPLAPEVRAALGGAPELTAAERAAGEAEAQALLAMYRAMGAPGPMPEE